jgi:large subunit ribosomal protein L22
MEIKARASHVTVTPRKVQLVANAVRDLRPQDAVEQLTYLNKSAALPLAKVIRQAIANAENNFKVASSELRIKTIVVTKGISLKRFLAGARGRGKPYAHTRSHITVILETKDTKTKLATPTIATKPAVKKVVAPKTATKAVVKKVTKKLSTKTVKNNEKSRTTGETK